MSNSDTNSEKDSVLYEHVDEEEVDERVLALLPKVKAYSHSEKALATFIVPAIEEAFEMAEEAEPRADIDLSPDNVREIKIDNREFKNPYVFFWLSDCTVGACETRRFRIGGLNDWNNYVHAVIDIRQF